MKNTTIFNTTLIFLGCFQGLTMSGLIYGINVLSKSLFQDSLKFSPNSIMVSLICITLSNVFGSFVWDYCNYLKGVRTCSILSSVVITFGFLLYTIFNSPLSLILSLSLIAFGGPGIQSTIVQLCELYPNSKSTVVAIITGSIQLSFLIFFILNNIQSSGDYTFRVLFLWYGLVCLVNVIISFVLWSNEPSFKYVELMQLIQDNEETTVRNSSIIELIKIDEKSKEIGSSNQLDKSSHNLRYLQSLKSAVFSYSFSNLLVFAIINSFWSDFLTDTLSMQFRDTFKLNDTEIDHYEDIFTASTILGLCLLPLIGYFVDQTSFSLSTTIITLLGCGWSICLGSKSVEAIIPLIVCFSIFRVSTFAILYIYVVVCIQSKHVAALLAILFAVGWVVSFIKYWLISNSMSWDSINIVCGISIACGLIFTGQDWKFQGKRSSNSKNQLVSSVDDVNISTSYGSMNS